MTGRWIAALQNVPLRRKLRVIVLGSTLLTLLLVTAVYVSYEWFAANQQLREDLTVRAQIIAANSTAALTFNDPDSAVETLEALRATPDVVRACLYRMRPDQANELFATYRGAGAPEVDCPVVAALAGAQALAGHMGVREDVRLQGVRVGTIFVEADLRKLWARLQAVIWGGLWVSLLVAALAYAASRLVERAIAQPVMDLHGLMQKVASSGDYSLRARPAGRDEVGALVGGFNTMLAQIAERDDELIEAQAALRIEVAERDRSNADLSQAMQRLRSTQDQLVQSEKMASLGGLVAGVAHEINTPIGVAYTAATTLQTRSRDLKDAYDEGQLRRSQLDKFVRQSSEIGDMIVKNLARAAELIQSFKQVAVDQTSSERRHFDLRAYIDETLLSLQPRLKKLPYEVHIECDVDVRIDGYPGAFSQVLTNLILNSVTHAFEGQGHGEIHIHAQRVDDEVHLRYEDDGIGMRSEHRKRIFDPFFTTKRGQGGSGLGMHIVYNLVTRTMGGSITLPSTSKGIAFDIRFPLRAP